MRYRYEDEGYRGEDRPFEGRQEIRHGRAGWDNPRSWEDRDEGSYWQSRGDSWEEDERRRGMVGRGGYAGGGGSYGRSRMQPGQSYGQGMSHGIGQAGWHERGDYERGRAFGNTYGNAGSSSSYGGGVGRDYDRDHRELSRDWSMQDRDYNRDSNREYGMRGGMREDWDRGRRDMGDWSQAREGTFSPRETGMDPTRERSHYYGPRGISAFGQLHTTQPMRTAPFDRGERSYSHEDHEEGIGNRMMRGIRNIFGAGGGGPKGYRRSDERIREDVCDRLVHLAQHAEVDSSEVEVQVKDGEVTLAGAVRERRWKHILEDIADGVPGVRDVHNQLRVNRDDPRSMEGMEERRGTTGATANNPLGGSMQGTSQASQAGSQIGSQSGAQAGSTIANGNPAMRRS